MKTCANNIKGDTALAYIKAIGTNEMKRARAFAQPRKISYRATEDPESPESFISLLEQYLEIASHLVPRAASADILSPTLWHPDLHRDNLFVDPDTNKITCIIDWQSAVVAPLFLQSGVPRMFRHSKPVDEDWAVPRRPVDYDNLSADEKAKVDADIESLSFHKYYRYQSLRKNPRHWACLEHQQTLELRRNPVKLVTKSWKNNDVFYFREALMTLVRRWDELNDSGTCPISFSDEAYRVHTQEEANITAVGEILRIFRDENMLPVDGMVDHVDYERVKENCLKFKKIFVGLGSTAEEKRLHERLWPYQDTDL
jgi:hypothetical protein